MLKIDKKIYQIITEHVVSTYPHECCGVLIGTIQNDEKSVLYAQAIPNLNTQRAHDRFEMDPKALMKIQMRASKENNEMVGIYHSHPDHPPIPSITDLSHAWPVYSYIIFSISGGTQIVARSWILDEQGDAFIEEHWCFA